MTPNNEALQLPQPMEQPPSGEKKAEKAEKGSTGAEAAFAEKSAQPGQPPAQAVPPANIPLPTPPATPANDQAASSNSNNPATADDGDLIEKEWVSKAKQIVDKTRNDPYKQSEELTVFKADYMKKRYNKSVKVNK